eukprot:scaffold143_cov173-Ochromonas_danica.AAC.19
MIEQYLGVTDPWMIKIIQVSVVTAWLGVILLLNSLIIGPSMNDDSAMEDMPSTGNDDPNNTATINSPSSPDKVDLKEQTRKDAEYSFILEFKQKTLQLAGTSKFETKNLIRGFRHLIDRLHEDRRYLEMWTQRFRSPTAYARQITPTSITGVVIDTSNRFASPLSPNSSSLSSWKANASSK